jgi:hypothetical protein
MVEELEASEAVTWLTWVKLGDLPLGETAIFMGKSRFETMGFLFRLFGFSLENS